LAQISALGLPPNEQKWQETVEVYGKDRTVDLRNIWTEIPGRDPDNGPVLLLAAHYDSKLCAGHPDPAHNFEFLGALDAAGSCGILIELMRVLKDRDNVPNIWIAWFDGEECLEFDWDRDNPANSLMGSRHFAQTMAADKERFPKGLSRRLQAMILLDLLGDEKQKIDKDTLSNSTLLDIFARASEQMGARDKLFEYVSPMTDDHQPFKNFGVAVLDLIDFRWRPPGEAARAAQAGGEPPAEEYTAWWHTADDTLDKISAASLGFAGNLVWHALPAIEKEIYGG